MKCCRTEFSGFFPGFRIVVAKFGFVAKRNTSILNSNVSVVLLNSWSIFLQSPQHEYIIIIVKYYMCRAQKHVQGPKSTLTKTVANSALVLEYQMPL